MSKTKTWAYGLTADEWLHLAAEGDDSEVTPCCGTLGDVRDMLNALVVSQGEAGRGMRQWVGKQLAKVVEADGEHGLQDARAFPLLHRVLAGIRAEAGQ